MKILYAPDTADHPNWGCRFMGDWYRRELARHGATPAWRLGSRWFFQVPQGMPQPATWNDIRAIGESVRSGTLPGSLTTALRDCDAVLMNGENFIRPQVMKGRMLLMLAYLASQVFGKRCVLTNLALDLSEPALAEIAANVLPGVAEVHVREETSLATLGEHVPGVQARMFPDVGWTATPRRLVEWGALARRDGHLSAWPDVVEGFDPLQSYATLGASSVFGGDEAAARAAVPAFVELARRLGDVVPQVLLVASCEIDAAILRRVSAQTGIPLLGLNVPVPQAIDVLGNARVHVGGRWHPGIFASTGGTPLVAFSSNNHKMRTLMGQLQPEAPVFDPRTLASQVGAVLAQARAQVAAGDALRGRIASQAARMAAQVRGNLDGLLAPAAGATR